MSIEVVLQTDFKEIRLLHRGKVRDIYDLEENLLIVATDRVSAFDVVLPNGIPYKGCILNQISAFWFKNLEEIVNHHMVTIQLEEYPSIPRSIRKILSGRAMIVKRAKPLPVECVVRGYLSGSGWNEYQLNGSICGVLLPEGIKESEKLKEPLFTPSTKAAIGLHDENIDFATMEKILGKKLAGEVRSLSVQIYQRTAALAEARGILIADTKFEFGLDARGRLMLIDEVLTPDSSRFWPLDGYAPGRSQQSLDKQYVRDYLISIRWDKKPPAPALPEEVIQKTSAKYMEIYQRLTGHTLKK